MSLKSYNDKLRVDRNGCNHRKRSVVIMESVAGSEELNRAMDYRSSSLKEDPFLESRRWCLRDRAEKFLHNSRDGPGELRNSSCFQLCEELLQNCPCWQLVRDFRKTVFMAKL